MFRKMGLVLLAVIVLILGYAAFQSPDYTISREVTIQASAEKIFPFLNSSKLADQWSPWKEVDPQAKMSFSGPDEGIGSKTSWEGGKNLGVGSATIVESAPNERVKIQLEYQEPMAMTQDAEYLVRSNGAESVVTWKVQGKNTFFGRVMCLFMNMDKVVGGMFEKGLANLKALAEKPS
jgi:uncharacterized protein YndB with AHSA1/START domain